MANFWLYLEFRATYNSPHPLPYSFCGGYPGKIMDYVPHIYLKTFKNENEMAQFFTANPNSLIQRIITHPCRRAHPRSVEVAEFISIEACVAMRKHIRKHRLLGYQFRDYDAARRASERNKRKIQKLYFGG